MKKIFLILIILVFQLKINSQTICSDTIYFDNIETFNWFGDWFTPAPTTGFFTNASVSPTSSAALYGSGNGTSAYESDWYVLPNITGLISTFTYKFKFRLASYRFTSTSNTRGVDIGDYIVVQLSTDGEVNYVNELQITGFSNAFWNYNNNGLVSKTANGSLTTYTPIAGGDRTNTGDGYSIIELILPPNTTQVAIDIFVRANSAGEEWWMDNFVLVEEFVCEPLPVELITFNGINKPQDKINKIIWKTATEINNDYFTIFDSYDGINWNKLDEIKGNGSTNEIIEYEYIDYNINENKYYKLSQTDYDGTTQFFNPIYIPINSDDNIKNIFYLNIQGQIVNIDEVETGIYLKVVEFYNKNPQIIRFLK